MNIGFAVPVSGSWATAENVTELAERAEDLGYSSLWTFQRLLSPVVDGKEILAPQYRSVQDPLAVLGFLAAKTKRARLGVAVLNMPYYAPVVLAKALTTLDHLCDGRLDVGLGIGWMSQELSAVGVSEKRRGARAEDYLRCLKAIWTDELVDYQGEFYRVPSAKIDPKPLQMPHPPILLGGAALPALQRAGRLSGGWISSSHADLASIDRSIQVVRDAAEAAGRDPSKLRFVCRGAVKVRATERAPLVGTLDQIRTDLEVLAAKGVTETFVDLNFDPEIGSPDGDPVVSMRRAHEVLAALAPG